MVVSALMTDLPAPQTPSDEELISRTLEGDDDAYTRIVERYQRRVFRLARSIVRDDMEADTITQDVFVKAYTRLDRFEGRSGLETWLIRIAINRSRDSLRRRRRWTSLFAPAADGDSIEIDPPDDRPDPERLLSSSELGRALERAMDDLSPQQRTILALRHFDDMPLEEIATTLGLRSGTVRAHLFRAVHKLRAQLSGWESGEADLKGSTP